MSTQLNGNYRGIVLVHGPKGRCKIRIPSVTPEKIGKVSYTETDTYANLLPWSEPALPVFAGNTSGHGICSWPEIGAVVWLFFEGGDASRPVYFASTPGGDAWLCGDDPENKDKYVIQCDNFQQIIDDSDSTETFLQKVKGSSQEIIELDKLISSKKKITLVVGEANIIIESTGPDSTDNTPAPVKMSISNGASSIVIKGSEIILDSAKIGTTSIFEVGVGATGFFLTPDFKCVTVSKGVVTGILGGLI